VPKISEQYFFWSGESKRESATGYRQRALKGVFNEAGIPDEHAHRFRNTLALGLLQAGVPMDRVSVLLGHSSTKVADKHYSPWVRACQEQLGADVRRTWERLQVGEGMTSEAGTKQEVQ
jgi:integrase